MPGVTRIYIQARSTTLILKNLYRIPCYNLMNVNNNNDDDNKVIFSRERFFG